MNQAGFSSAQLQVASDGGVNGGHTGTSGTVKGGRIASVSIVGVVVVVKVDCRRRGEEGVVNNEEERVCCLRNRLAGWMGEPWKQIENETFPGQRESRHEL